MYYFQCVFQKSEIGFLQKKGADISVAPLLNLVFKIFTISIIILGCFYQEALLNAMNDELQRIQEQVYYGNINSYTDVLEKVLSESGINRYNPQVKSEL